MPSGSIGISCIGFIGGYYFARFFERSTSITPMQLGTLLTLLGIGPTALVLVQGYFRLSLLDPYGIGLVLGVFVNFILRNTLENAVLKKLIPSSGAAAGDEGRAAPPKVSLLETVSETSSASSLGEAATRAVERRYLARFAEQAVERWLRSQYPSVEGRRESFPDFLVKTPDQLVGVEVILAGQSRAILNIFLRQFLFATRKGIQANEFSESWLVIVADSIGRAGYLAGLLNEWQPGPPVRVIVGTIRDDGTFRPLDKVERNWQSC